MVGVNDKAKGVRGGGTTAFLVDRSMGWTSSPIPTMGEGGPASLFFDDVRVPARNVLGEVGQGFELGMQWIGKGRYIIPSYAIGIAERALGMAITQANTRVTFGKPIAENQAIAWMIADSEVELEAARGLTLRAAWTVDQGEDPRHTSSMAKLYTAGMVNRVVDRGHAGARRDGLHQGIADRILAPYGAAVPDLRGDRRDAATDHLSRPAARLHQDRRAIVTTVFATLDELRGAIGEVLGPGPSILVDQGRIQAFADATEDHQWIHLDAERAAAGPFGGTIAHGYLTLSLLPALAAGLYRVEGVAMGVNYGLNKVRFPSPVLSGSTVRASARIDSVEEIAGGVQVVATITVSVDGSEKPCCVAESVSRLYFARAAS